MASDDESMLSSLPSDIVATSIAKSTLSTPSSINPPARNTRFFEKRLPVVLPKPTKLPNTPNESAPTGTDDEEHNNDNHQELGSETESDLLHLQTPGPGSSIS